MPRSKPAPINQILAANIERHMTLRGWVQEVLATKAGMAQTTVGLYLHPENRKVGKSGKPPSAKVSEVESIAHAFGLEAWELLQIYKPRPGDAEYLRQGLNTPKPKPPRTGTQDA